MLQEDDSVSCSQIQAQPPHVGGQQQHLNGGVAVEALHNAKPFLGLHTANSNMSGTAERDATSGFQMCRAQKSTLSLRGDDAGLMELQVTCSS